MSVAYLTDVCCVLDGFVRLSLVPLESEQQWQLRAKLELQTATMWGTIRKLTHADRGILFWYVQVERSQFARTHAAEYSRLMRKFAAPMRPLMLAAFRGARVDLPGVRDLILDFVFGELHKHANRSATTATAPNSAAAHGVTASTAATIVAAPIVAAHGVTAAATFTAATASAPTSASAAAHGVAPAAQGGATKRRREELDETFDGKDFVSEELASVSLSKRFKSASAP
jgi:hypothetical protein